MYDVAAQLTCCIFLRDGTQKMVGCRRQHQHRRGDHHLILLLPLLHLNRFPAATDATAQRLIKRSKRSSRLVTLHMAGYFALSTQKPRWQLWYVGVRQVRLIPYRFAASQIAILRAFFRRESLRRSSINTNLLHGSILQFASSIRCRALKPSQKEILKITSGQSCVLLLDINV